MSSELGNTRIAPSRSDISPPPAGGPGGTEVVGSGNPGTPCRRMHCATLTSCASACAEGCVVEPGPGRPMPGMSFWHFACGSLNIGDDGLLPAPAGKTKPPPAFGSGKLGAPLARMHWLYFSASCCSCVWLGGETEPTAAPPVIVLLAELLDVVVTLATDGDVDPPHPASCKGGRRGEKRERTRSPVASQPCLASLRCPALQRCLSSARSQPVKTVSKMVSTAVVEIGG